MTQPQTDRRCHGAATGRDEDEPGHDANQGNVLIIDAAAADRARRRRVQVLVNMSRDAGRPSPPTSPVREVGEMPERARESFDRHRFVHVLCFSHVFGIARYAASSP